MWIMTPFGIIMPAAAPVEVQDNEGWDLQVRSRERTALIYFQKRYMPAGGFTRVKATPLQDYDFRFFTRKPLFMDAIDAMVDDIDYEKFKPTTLRRGMGGEKLHKLYNRIWAEYLAAYGTDNMYTNAPRRGRKGSK
jgi:hypothetical protein